MTCFAPSERQGALAVPLWMPHIAFLTVDAAADPATLGLKTVPTPLKECLRESLVSKGHGGRGPVHASTATAETSEATTAQTAREDACDTPASAGAEAAVKLQVIEEVVAAVIQSLAGFAAGIGAMQTMIATMSSVSAESATEQKAQEEVRVAATAAEDIAVRNAQEEARIAPAPLPTASCGGTAAAASSQPPAQPAPSQPVSAIPFDLPVFSLDPDLVPSANTGTHEVHGHGASKGEHLRLSSCLPSTVRGEG